MAQNAKLLERLVKLNNKNCRQGKISQSSRVPILLSGIVNLDFQDEIVYNLV